jgi:hypothetical protein
MTTPNNEFGVEYSRLYGLLFFWFLKYKHKKILCKNIVLFWLYIFNISQEIVKIQNLKKIDVAGI